MARETYILTQNENKTVSQTGDSQPDITQTKKVLLAEDDASVRRYLEVILRRAGYTVFPAEDGAAAMQQALENSFDIAVLDAIMPNMTGYELCRIFRGHPNFQNIPLIILSGLETETGAEADAYLLKTANLNEELLILISRLLENR